MVHGVARMAGSLCVGHHSDFQMNLCKTCKWWGGQELCTSYGKENPLIDLYGLCNNPKVDGSHPLQHKLPNGHYRFFRRMAAKAEVSDEWVRENKIEREASHTVPLDQATPDAADSHGLCFVTGPDFGCIHHEPK